MSKRVFDHHPFSEYVSEQPRRRSWLSRLTRSRPKDSDVERLNTMLNDAVGGRESVDFTTDGKMLASLSKIGSATTPVGTAAKSGGANTQVSYSLLRDVSLKSEVVNAILRRTVDDTIANGYEFVLADGVSEGSEEQRTMVRDFFKNPNPDDVGDEWLEALVYDLALFGDAYLELDGSDDRAKNGGEDWNYGGELVAVWPIPADTMTLMPSNQTPAPPAMAYIQKINSATRRFSSEKVLHITKFRHGRGYGTSPLIPLLNTIAGQMNLSNYLNELYTGTLPKTILNVGDISNSEMKAMLGLIEQQLSGGKSPFGLIAINGGGGFNMHRIIDSTREGMQLDMLYYYREEICAVFGIPPMKLGWVQTGKLANPEQQLDAWYDVVESYQNRVSAMLNNRVLPLLGITDWQFKFITIRPKRDKERAETLNQQAGAIATLRQEGAISINEARELLGYSKLDQPEADDALFVSPKLSINMGADAAAAQSEESERSVPTLFDLFPAPPMPDGEGEGAGEFPSESMDEMLADSDAQSMMVDRRLKATDEFSDLIDDGTAVTDSVFTANQSDFADSLLSAYDSRFADGDEAIPNPDVELSFPIISRKQAISLDDVEWAIRTLDDEAAVLLGQQATGIATTNLTAYEGSLALTVTGTGIAAALGSADTMALSYWNRRWVLPALRRTVGSYRGSVIGVFQNMIQRGESWAWAKREMKSVIDPSGDKYPTYYYERIARTETRRVVEGGHLSGLRQAGFVYVQRLVEEDTQTDKELCSPFSNEIYRLSESGGVLPAHPNCRCTFVAYQGTPKEPLDSSDVLRPTPEGSE